MYIQHVYTAVVYTTVFVTYSLCPCNGPLISRAQEKGDHNMCALIHTAINLAALKAMVGRKVADFLIWAVYQFEQGDVLLALLNLSLQKS